jgi:hypothetical protein
MLALNRPQVPWRAGKKPDVSAAIGTMRLTFSPEASLCKQSLTLLPDRRHSIAPN